MAESSPADEDVVGRVLLDAGDGLLDLRVLECPLFRSRSARSSTSSTAVLILLVHEDLDTVHDVKELILGEGAALVGIVEPRGGQVLLEQRSAVRRTLVRAAILPLPPCSCRAFVSHGAILDPVDRVLSHSQQSTSSLQLRTTAVHAIRNSGRNGYGRNRSYLVCQMARKAEDRQTGNRKTAKQMEPPTIEMSHAGASLARKAEDRQHLDTACTAECPPTVH